MANKFYKGCEFDGYEDLTVEEVVIDKAHANDPHYAHGENGEIRVREGDFLVHGLKKAPRGYHSQYIPIVVRKDDDRLTLGEPMEPVVDEGDDTRTDYEDDEYDAPRKRTAAKKTATKKAAPATPPKEGGDNK